MILNIYPYINNTSNGIASVLKNIGTDSQIKNHTHLTSDVLDEKIDAVILHGCYSLKYPFQIIFCKIKKKRVYWMPHGSLQKNTLKKSTIKKLIYHLIISKFCIKFSSGTIFTCQGEKIKSEWLLKKGKYKIIYNSIPKINSTSIQKNQISYIGRIDTHHKGIDRFIEWLADYKYPTNMYGYNQDNLYKSIGSILFHGEINRNQVLDILKKTKVFIMLSRYEGLPMSALEAFGAGCIVVCTEECNLNEFIEKYKCGFIVKNKIDVINALNFIFEPCNSEAVLEMSKNSTLLASECFSLEKQLSEFKKL